MNGLTFRGRDGRGDNSDGDALYMVGGRGRGSGASGPIRFNIGGHPADTPCAADELHSETTALTVAATGDVGVGVGNPHHTGVGNSLEVRGNISLAAADRCIGWNAYRDDSSDQHRRIADGPAVLLQTNENGRFSVRTAPDGPSETEAELTEQFAVAENGGIEMSKRVGVGRVAPASGLAIQAGASGQSFLACYAREGGGGGGPGAEIPNGRFVLRWAGAEAEGGGEYSVGVSMYSNSDRAEVEVGQFENPDHHSAVAFTGEHRVLMNSKIDHRHTGLVVSATGAFVNADNTLRATITESLPVCALARLDNDKRAFGVITGLERAGVARVYGDGCLKTVQPKSNANERRVRIGVVGSGGVWVCNKNGPIENGDYITTSSVPGYGALQTISGRLRASHTVAKATCDCDFGLAQVAQQKLLVSGALIRHSMTGDIQYEDDLAPNGNPLHAPKHETRFVTADGTLLVDAKEYRNRKTKGETVYVACFIGCAFQCG